ncbi:MAG: AtpZ/AtpI family protein [Desulfatiglandales bacterium]
MFLRPRARQVKFFNLKNDKAWIEDLALLSQVGLTMAGSILLCFAVGFYLDKWLGTKGLFITVFILLGIAGGGYTAYRQIAGVIKTDGKRKGQDGDTTR